MTKTLEPHPGGQLLDVGCGPGVLVRHLLATRPGAFTITACDSSRAMVDAVAKTTASNGGNVESVVASVEALPFADGRFDVVTALGVLEYTDCSRAVKELGRVCRPGGLVIISMLNSASPYRLFEWFVYRPALRIAGRVERRIGVPGGPRHDAPPSGIRTVRRGTLCRLIRDAGLTPHEVIYYDVNALVPPFDRIVRRWSRSWRQQPDRTIARAGRGWLGTAFLITAIRVRA